MKFTEEKLEKAFVELLGNENYPHFHGDFIVRAADEVLIKNEMKKK
jgi:type I restriction enzyme R subunit